jgi:hypothetical protein
VSAAAGRDRPDLVASLFGEPEIAVGTEGDPGRLAAGRRHGRFLKGLRTGNSRPAARPTHDDNQNKPQRQLSRSATFPHMTDPPLPSRRFDPGQPPSIRRSRPVAFFGSLSAPRNRV